VPAKHRAAASCGNPGLGLSHRGDSRWRVPWRSAGRRARLSVRSRCRASGNWRNNAPFGASPPFFVSLLFLRLVVVSKARALAKRRENDLAYPPPHAVRGRGTARRAVEGACRAAASGESVAPPTALRAVPPPRCAGLDEVRASLRASAKQSRAARTGSKGGSYGETCSGETRHDAITANPTIGAKHCQPSGRIVWRQGPSAASAAMRAIGDPAGEERRRNRTWPA
jgi:hypothetical protein